jgi:hypothetical protein
MMKHLVLAIALGLCLLVIPAWVFGLTYTTPNTTDGVVESDPPVLGGTTWESDELIDSDTDTDFYFTWDDTTFYFAIAGSLANQGDGNYDFFLAFDTDQIAGSGATSDGYGQVTFTGDYLPEVIYYFAGCCGWHESSEWDTTGGGSWIWRGWTDYCTYGGWDDNKTTEACFADSLIQYAESLAVVAWITNEDNNQILASFPHANPIGATSQEMEYFFVAKNLGSGVSPVMLPVLPPQGDAVVDNEQSFEFTCTAMADITPGNCGNTTSMTFYYTTDGSTPDETDAFVVGTYDDCRTGADTSDTYYAIIPAPDDALVTWIAKGTAKNGFTDWSDTTFTFTQGGTAWVGNEGSSPTTCTAWAEIYVGDGGATTFVKFPYTTDGSDPRVSATVDTLDGVFDTQFGNNDKYYAVFDMVPDGQTVSWFAFGEDVNSNYDDSDSSFFTFIQGDTADIFNLTCDPDTDFVLVTGEVEPPGYGAGMDFYWTLDGSDPKTSPDTYMAKGFHIEDTDSTGKFGAWLAADLGNTVTWYVHAYGSDNAYSDSPNQTCVAAVDSRPTICNLRCVPDSAIIRASLSPRGFGSEMGFKATVDGSDPKTSGTAADFPVDNYLREEETPGGDCGVPVAVFQVALPGSIQTGATINWYAYAYYREGNEYQGLFGESATQSCVAETTLAGVDLDDLKPLVTQLSNAPNPFSGKTDIKFELSGASRVSILVYDVNGRTVDTVLESVLPAGQHTVAWDGRSNTGETLPSGIYFFRFKAGSYEVNKKAILIR